MKFQSMGTIANSVRSMVLEKKWHERKQNSLADREEDPMVADMRRQIADIRRSNTISSIKTRLKTGARLSNSEMDFLRNNSPELYKKATRIEAEREEYQRQLQNARTREEVERINFGRMQQFVSEARTISSNPNIPEHRRKELLEFIAMRTAMTMTEHTRFINSPEYHALPSEKDDDEFVPRSVTPLTLDERIFSFPPPDENDSGIKGYIYTPGGEFSVSDNKLSEVSSSEVSLKV